MNKLIVTPIALSLLTLALTGCGGDDDGIYGSGSSSNKFTVSSFDSNSNAIARIDTTYQAGKREVQPTNIIGTSQPNINNLDLSIVLASGFEGTLEDKNISVNGTKVSQPIYQKNSNNLSEYTIDYQEYDLSGITAGSYKIDKSTGKRSGVLTDLYNYSRLSTTIAFPRGAKCYTPVTNSVRELVFFNEKNITGYKQIKPWTDFIENQIGSGYSKKTITASLGVNKQYPLARVQAYDSNQQLVATYNGVEYNGRVYNTNYAASGTTIPNRDAALNVVDCTLVNDVAADFLEAQIKAKYS